MASELLFDGTQYHIDFEDFERKITENGVKLFLLGSPHNPVGRVWTREELAHMAEICLRHGVFVVATKSTRTLSTRDTAIRCSPPSPRRWPTHAQSAPPPSKTFNLAALHNANVFIATPQARKAFPRELDAEGFSQPNIMGLVACQAAYRHGADWLDQLVEYLADNIALMEETFRRKMPRLRLVNPQGTYLPWVDFSGLRLPPPR